MRIAARRGRARRILRSRASKTRPEEPHGQAPAFADARRTGAARGRARVSPHAGARQDRRLPDQAARQPARPVARLFAGRGVRLPRDRGGPAARRRIHLAREPGRRGHQRHRSAGTGRHRSAGRQAGDGGQGLPVQEVRRHRRLRHRTRREGPRQAGRDHRGARADARRHQPRGHQGAGVLHHREEASRAAEDPGVSRRPARYGDHLDGGAVEQPRADRPPHRVDAGVRLGGRCSGDRLPRPDGGAGRAPGAHRRRRLERRRARRSRRARPVEAALCPQDGRPHARRRGEGRRRVPRLLDRRRPQARDGGDDGRASDHPRACQPRARDPARARQAGAPRLHRRDRPLGLPEPGQQRPLLPLHLPWRARRGCDVDYRRNEARVRARDRGARQGRGQRRRRDGLRRAGARLRARLHHPEAVRHAPHHAHRARSGRGGAGLGCRDTADRRPRCLPRLARPLRHLHGDVHAPRVRRGACPR